VVSELVPISSLRSNLQLSQSYAESHERIATGSAFQSHERLFRCLRGPFEFREFLSSITVLSSLLATASPGHSASFASLVDCDGVSCVVSALGTVSVDLFGKLQL
jgi:hypothetical protein